MSIIHSREIERGHQVKISIVGIAALPMATLIHASPVQACNIGPQCGEVTDVPASALQFIADAHNAGIPGSPVTTIQIPDARGQGTITLDVTNRKRNINQVDANIYAGGGLLCFALWGRGGEVPWQQVNTYFGVTPSSSQLSVLFGSLKANNICPT